MPAPKGRTYTPTRGALAGQTFIAPASATGQSAAYNVYQQHLARHYGYTSYHEMKTAQGGPLHQNVFQRARARGQSVSSSHALARRIVGTKPIRGGPGTHRGTETGRRMRDAIDAMYEAGLYSYGEDFEESSLYE